jgi:hypothetical protein
VGCATNHDHIIGDIGCGGNVSEDGDGEMDVMDAECATGILIIDDVGCSGNVAEDSDVHVDMGKQDIDVMDAGCTTVG